MKYTYKNITLNSKTNLLKNKNFKTIYEECKNVPDLFLRNTLDEYIQSGEYITDIYHFNIFCLYSLILKTRNDEWIKHCNEQTKYELIRKDYYKTLNTT